MATTRLNLLLLSSWLRFSGFNHSPRFTFFGIFSPFDSLFIFLFFIFNVFLCQFCSFFILWLLENPNFRVTCDQMPVFPMLSRFWYFSVCVFMIFYANYSLVAGVWCTIDFAAGKIHMDFFLFLPIGVIIWILCNFSLVFGWCFEMFNWRTGCSGSSLIWV